MDTLRYFRILLMSANSSNIMEFDELADGEEGREHCLTSKAVMARGSVYTYLQDDDKSGVVSLWWQIKQTITDNIQ